MPNWSRYVTAYSSLKGLSFRLSKWRHSRHFHPDNDDSASCSIAIEPLSVIASVLNVGAFTTASSKVILKVRGASDEVQALINKISDLSAIIKDVKHTLHYKKRLNAESAGVASLHAVLSKANTAINHLRAFKSRVLREKKACSGTRGHLERHG